MVQSLITRQSGAAVVGAPGRTPTIGVTSILFPALSLVMAGTPCEAACNARLTTADRTAPRWTFVWI